MYCTLNMYLYSFSVTALTCPPVQVIGNATADTDLALQGTVVTYTCVNSQWFAIGVKSISVLCQTDLTWSPIIQACMGAYGTIMDSTLP